MLSGSEFDSSLLTGSIEDFGNLSFVEYERGNQGDHEDLLAQEHMEQGQGVQDPINPDRHDQGPGDLNPGKQDRIDPNLNGRIEQGHQPPNMTFNYRQVEGLITVYDGKPADLDRFIRCRISVSVDR